MSARRSWVAAGVSMVMLAPVASWAAPPFVGKPIITSAEETDRFVRSPMTFKAEVVTNGGTVTECFYRTYMQSEWLPATLTPPTQRTLATPAGAVQYVARDCVATNVTHPPTQTLHLSMKAVNSDGEVGLGAIIRRYLDQDGPAATIEYPDGVASDGEVWLKTHNNGVVNGNDSELGRYMFVLRSQAPRTMNPLNPCGAFGPLRIIMQTQPSMGTGRSFGDRPAAATCNKYVYLVSDRAGNLKVHESPHVAIIPDYPIVLPSTTPTDVTFRSGRAPK